MSVYLHLYLQNKVQTLQPGTQVLLVLTHQTFPSLISCSLLTMLAHVKFLQPPLPVKTTPICHARQEAVLKLPCRNFPFLQHPHSPLFIYIWLLYYCDMIHYSHVMCARTNVHQQRVEPTDSYTESHASILYRKAIFLWNSSISNFHIRFFVQSSWVRRNHLLFFSKMPFFNCKDIIF